MGSVIEFRRRSVSEEESKVLNFPLGKFIHSVFAAVKRKQNDIKRKKIEILQKEIYKFYLDLYLTNLTERQIDFPDFMYETGKIICSEAMYKAEEAILSVIKANRVDSCFDKLQKMNKF